MLSDLVFAVRDGYRQLCPTGDLNSVTVDDLARLVRLPPPEVKSVAQWANERGLIGEGLIGVGKFA